MHEMTQCSADKCSKVRGNTIQTQITMWCVVPWTTTSLADPPRCENAVPFWQSNTIRPSSSESLLLAYTTNSSNVLANFHVLLLGLFKTTWTSQSDPPARSFTHDGLSLHGVPPSWSCLRRSLDDFTKGWKFPEFKRWFDDVIRPLTQVLK